MTLATSREKSISSVAIQPLYVSMCSSRLETLCIAAILQDWVVGLAKSMRVVAIAPERQRQVLLAESGSAVSHVWPGRQGISGGEMHQRWRGIVCPPILKGTLHCHCDDVLKVASEGLRLKFICQIKALRPSLDKAPATQMWEVLLMLARGGQSVWSNIQQPGDDEGCSSLEVLRAQR